MPMPDGNTPGLRISECSRMVSVEMLQFAMSEAVILRTYVKELLDEVPGADFIEIRAIRYDKEDSDERSAQQSPDPEPPLV